MKKTTIILLSRLRVLGIRLHATGGSVWLGFLPVVAAAMLKLPSVAMTAAIVAFFLWFTLCVSRLIPKEWVTVEKPEPAEVRQMRFKLNDMEQEMRVKIGDLKQKLLGQYSFRVTNALRGKGLEKVSWDFVSLEPLALFLAGEKVRIELADDDHYSAAEVSFDKAGAIVLSLIEKADTEPAETPKVVLQAVESLPDSQTAETLHKWLDDHMDKLETVAFEKKQKGARQFLLESSDLPSDKSLWQKLAGLLVSEGFASAMPAENGIMLGIGMAA